MSDTRWRQVVRGWQRGTVGQVVEAKASANLLARMARAVGVTPEQLTEVGRPDAAEQLRRMPAREEPRRPTFGDGDDEIELIRVSESMSARQKLQLIRTVLQLRAEAEREESRGGGEAPADDGGASLEQSPS